MADGNNTPAGLTAEKAQVHVLLDVDGVINAVRWGKPPADGWDRHEKYKHVFGRYEGAPLTGAASGAFPIRYSPDLIDALNALSKRAGVAFYWLTTWLDEARYGLAPRVGLDGADWPVLGKDEHRSVVETWWKLPAAQAPPLIPMFGSSGLTMI